MTLLSVKRTRTLGPPSRALRYLPVSALVLDFLLMAGVFFLAIVGRRRLGVFDSPTDVTSTLQVVGPLVLLSWLVVIAAFGGYRDDIFGAGTDEYKRVFNASIVTAGLLGVGCYLAKFQLSRGFFLLAFCLGVPALLLGRWVLRRAVHRARRQGKLQYRVLIAGSSEHVDEIAAVLQRESWLGYHVSGALVPASELQEETAAGVPVIGACEQATAVITAAEADLVFFAGGALTSAGQLRRIVWDLEKADVQVVVAPSVTDISGERIKVRPVGGLPLMHIDPPRSTDAARWGKRLFDLFGSTFLILAFSPLMAYAAVRVKLADGGPVFFNQVRTGRDGKQFGCLKFRTMVVDAEEQLAALHAQIGHDGGLFSTLR